MRRLALIAVGLLLALGALVTTAASGGGTDTTPSFTIEVDNAFGLVNGGDVKVAGVRAGKVASISLDKRTLHALIGVKISVSGFGSFRTDATCSSRPQSLIGEYFVDCDPGHSPNLLRSGGRIPVTQTTSTIAPDLVNDILRRPYDERLSLIIDELGAAVAGRGADLNAALHRAVPALAQFDQVLAGLANQNATLKDLTQNGDTVIRGLAQGQGDVTHFVDASANLATLSAQRRANLQATFHRLPRFFAELGPTMQQLGAAADANTPALADLNTNAGLLRRFFNDLGPVADAGRPAVKTLSQAADEGRRTIPALTPIVGQLNQLSTNVPELAQNLRIILDHLDNRSFAVEANPQSPGGKGYTGLEGILNYVFDQTLSTNIHDATHNILKVDLFADPDCSPYADAKAVNNASPAVLAKCNAFLGPNQPGLRGQPDFNDQTPGFVRSSPRAARTRSAPRRSSVPAAAAHAAPVPASSPAPGPASSPAPSPAPPGSTAPGGSSGLGQTLQQILHGNPNIPLPVPLPGAGASRSGGSGSGPDPGSAALLSYLMAP